MKVYRILIDSAKRQPGGHEYDFEFDISRLATARDFKRHTWITAVEWNDPVKYSEVFPTFAKHPPTRQPSSLPTRRYGSTTRRRVGPALPPAPFAFSLGTRVSATTDAAPTRHIVARRLWEISSRATG